MRNRARRSACRKTCVGISRAPSLFWPPRRMRLQGTSASIFDRRCRNRAPLIPDAVLRCAPAGHFFSGRTLLCAARVGAQICNAPHRWRWTRCSRRSSATGPARGHGRFFLNAGAFIGLMVVSNALEEELYTNLPGFDYFGRRVPRAANLPGAVPKGGRPQNAAQGAARILRGLGASMALSRPGAREQVRQLYRVDDLQVPAAWPCGPWVRLLHCGSLKF